MTELVDRVEAGDIIGITRRGRPVARLSEAAEGADDEDDAMVADDFAMLGTAHRPRPNRLDGRREQSKNTHSRNAGSEPL